MESTFLETGDRRWLQFLEKTPHGPHHLPGYVDLAASHEGGIPCAFWARAERYEMLIPLLIHEVPGIYGESRCFDAATPYGCASPLIYPLSRCINCLSSAHTSSQCVQCASRTAQRENVVTEKLFESLLSACADHRIVSVFGSSCPLIPWLIDAFRQHGILIQHASTVYVDLSLKEEELTRQLRKSFRAQVRHLEKDGFTAEIDNFSHFATFVELYHKSMRRLKADAFYFFSREYFKKLCRVNGLDVHLCSVLNSEKRMVSGGLYLHSRGIVEAFLTGTDDEYVSRSVSKLAHVEMMKWCKKRGYQLLHLGGGVGGGKDSLLKYKQGFSPDYAPFYTWRLVCNNERYQKLVMESRQLHSLAGPDGFFPAYRRERAGQDQSLLAPSVTDPQNVVRLVSSGRAELE